MSTPDDLVTTLLEVDEHEYARFVAHWMTRASDLDAAARLTGNEVVDALVAAAAAMVQYERTGAEPAWTHGRGRALTKRLWHPGAPGMFPYSLVHAPGSFIVRGIVIARDALVCV
ncbi:MULTISPECIES: hypothetical protein [Mycolicibacter]|uniref:Uncharacterized protein n=2 Tax=Mycolicibacter TaxID=1073531 RepID=A0ABU5XKW3_9MYCO|nr:MULTISPECIES: hypothetical protein [unclassified Mycolicibacter]MEB3022920.1 hypothetical protein [Mycolicibacter sp. MYC098]MEB3034985.1 hypothetical protein [Mycolicibacter sp. MYC340]